MKASEAGSAKTHWIKMLTINRIFLAAVFLVFWPISINAADDDIDSPRYRDDAMRFVAPDVASFALPESAAGDPVSLQIHRICIRENKIVAQLRNSLVTFDLSNGNANIESFPFRIIDSTCGDRAHRHLVAWSWPDGQVYSLAVKTDDPWSGWRRGDPIKLLKDEMPLGYVEGEQEVRLLTTRRLLVLEGDKIGHALPLSHPIELFAVARVAIVRVKDDIYFGIDGGEWGGILYRIDSTSGKISLKQPGNPVVSIVTDPAHDGCVLVARGLSHITLADGELTRVCHGTSDTLVEHEPVWSIAGKDPIVVAFSDGFGELQQDTIVNRRKYPAFDHVVAGLHYTTLPGIILLSSGINQSVSVSGPVPMLAEWQDHEGEGK